MAWAIHFSKKAPKKHHIRTAKVFRRPNILIILIYIIFFHQKIWIFIFWTPSLAKIAFYWLGLSIFQKRLPKCTTSKRQKFSGDPIFWSSIQKMHFRDSLSRICCECFQGVFKEALRGFKEVSRGFQECFTYDSRKFQVFSL